MPFVSTHSVTRKQDPETRVITFFQNVVILPENYKDLPLEEAAAYENTLAPQIWFIPSKDTQKDTLVIGLQDNEVEEGMNSLPYGVRVADDTIDANSFSEAVKPDSNISTFLAISGRDNIHHVLHTLGESDVGRPTVGHIMAMKAKHEISLCMQ